MILAETLKVNANYSAIYTQIIDGHSDTCQSAQVNFADHFHDCRMSPAAVKAVKKGVNVILYLSRQAHYKAAFKDKKVGCTTKRNAEIRQNAYKSIRDTHLCTFVTLTLPSKQIHSDVELTKYCVNVFLAYARKYFHVRHYIWKKELQKNGNLHYHFVVDRYIDAMTLRKTWNRIVNSGKVDGVDNPFDYVDRYSYRMQDLFADGWNETKMLEYCRKSNRVLERTDDEINIEENKRQSKLSDAERTQILTRNQFAELERMKKAYEREMALDAEHRWRNPNSTDISAIRSPKQVSIYVAKYIAKDTAETPVFKEYWNDVRDCKDKIFSCLSDINKKRRNGDPVNQIDLDAVEYWKEVLSDIRKKQCPIHGKLWFKSASLTPFMSGTSEIINYQLGEELKHLMDYLADLESRTGKKYILYNYGTKEDGTPDTSNIICVTLLINIFQLQMLKDRNKYRFPTLVRMWQRFVFDCKDFNRRRGLYKRDSEDVKEYESMITTKIQQQ